MSAFSEQMNPVLQAQGERVVEKLVAGLHLEDGETIKDVIRVSYEAGVLAVLEYISAHGTVPW